MVADAGRRAELSDWLARKVRPMFDQRVLPVTEDILLKWRPPIEDASKAGHTFSQPGLIIAATALEHGLTILSRDTPDMSGPSAGSQSMQCRPGILDATNQHGAVAMRNVGSS